MSGPGLYERAKNTKHDVNKANGTRLFSYNVISCFDRKNYTEDRPNRRKHDLTARVANRVNLLSGNRGCTNLPVRLRTFLKPIQFAVRFP